MQLIVIFLCLFSSPKIASACSSQEGVCCEHARFGATHPTSKKDRRHTHYSLERSTSDRLHTTTARDLQRATRYVSNIPLSETTAEVWLSSEITSQSELALG